MWLSFLIAGAVAGLQGYSFAKFGARYPSAGGMLEYVSRGFGDGHVTGVIAWLLLAANAIVTGMVAVSFGSYASAAVADGSEAWVKVFAVLVVVAMTLLNVVGFAGGREGADGRSSSSSSASCRCSRSTTLANINIDLLAFSGYPSCEGHRLQRRVDVLRVPRIRRRDVHREGPDSTRPASCPGRSTSRSASRPSSTSPSSLGVFGTLTVDEVIDSGGTALAVAAEPVLGRAGYWLMTRHGAVRDLGRDERRPLSGGRAVRGDGGEAPVPARARSTRSADGRRRASCSPPRSRSCSPSASTSAPSRRSAARSRCACSR